MSRSRTPSVLVARTARSFSGVSDRSISWIALSRSAWRERLRRAARLLTTGVAIGLALVLVFDSELIALAGAAGAVLLCAIGWQSQVQLANHCWRVTNSG